MAGAGYFFAMTPKEQLEVAMRKARMGTDKEPSGKVILDLDHEDDEEKLDVGALRPTPTMAQT